MRCVLNAASMACREDGVANGDTIEARPQAFEPHENIKAQPSHMQPKSPCEGLWHHSDRPLGRCKEDSRLFPLEGCSSLHEQLDQALRPSGISPHRCVRSARERSTTGGITAQQLKENVTVRRARHDGTYQAADDHDLLSGTPTQSAAGGSHDAVEIAVQGMPHERPHSLHGGYSSHLDIPPDMQTEKPSRNYAREPEHSQPLPNGQGAPIRSPLRGSLAAC